MIYTGNQFPGVPTLSAGVITSPINNLNCISLSAWRERIMMKHYHESSLPNISHLRRARAKQYSLQKDTFYRLLWKKRKEKKNMNKIFEELIQNREMDSVAYEYKKKKKNRIAFSSSKPSECYCISGGKKWRLLHFLLTNQCALWLPSRNLSL